MRNNSKKLVELPPWFTPERYRHLECSSYNVVLSELWLRYNVQEELEKRESDECQSLLFSERFPRDDELPDKDIYNALGLNVKMLSSPVLKILAGEVAKECDAQDNRYVHEIGICNLLGDCFISLNLKTATNKEIVNELAILLEQLRNSPNIPDEPDRFRSGEKFDIIFQKHLFEYIDLILWSNANNLKIKPKFISDSITNVHGVPRFTPIEIGRKVKENAEHILTMEYLFQLEADIATNKL